MRSRIMPHYRADTQSRENQGGRISPADLLHLPAKAADYHRSETRLPVQVDRPPTWSNIGELRDSL